MTGQRRAECLFVPDAARALGVTKQRVRSMIDAGQLHGVRDRWTTPRIPVESVEAFVSAQGGWRAWRKALRDERNALVAETERIRARTQAAELSAAESSLPELKRRAREIVWRNGRRRVRRVLDEAKAAGIPMSPEKARGIAARKKPKVSANAIEERVFRARRGGTRRVRWRS